MIVSENMDTYEKKYKEMVKRVKEFHEAGNFVTRQQMEIICPELAESEDEMILASIADCVSLVGEDGDVFSNHNVTKVCVLSWLEKQKEQKPADNPMWTELTCKDINELERIINNVHYEFQNGIGEDSFGELVLERFREYKDDGSMDEQKPAESISQLTVQGKGVYKICPRCKERMVRDDSMVYTSMPPQYRYECPKYGEIEFDTVMYDNPEMKEQKPVEWSEEDEAMMNNILRVLSCFIGSMECESNTALSTSYPLYRREMDWLKSLRERLVKENGKPSES